MATKMCKRCAMAQKYRKGNTAHRLKFLKRPSAFIVRGRLSFGPGAGVHPVAHPVT